MNKRSETRKVAAKLDILVKAYYKFLSKMPKDLSKKDQKQKIMKILKDYDSKWRCYCKKYKRKNNNLNQPNPDLFIEAVTTSNKMKKESIKEEIKKVKPTIL